jgi:anaerobic selenocysteine-containing dehydrogenase
LVVDPRRTETAAQFEWLGIVPDADAYLLLSLLQVLFAEKLADRECQADGLDWLQSLSEPFTPEVAAGRTGIDPDAVRALARDLAATPRAAIYGRFGTSVGRHATLTMYLIDAVNIVAGNFDRPGGSVFSVLDIPGQKWGMKVMGAGLRRAYQKKRSRIGGFRSAIGSEPAALMAKEITTPGKRQLLMRGGRGHRALMHVDDAADLKIADGDVVQVSSPYGRITVPVAATKDLVTGVIAIPHGWGHKGTGGWQLANRAGGSNVNQLTSSEPEDVESLSGMSWLTGVPVRVEPVHSAPVAQNVA